MIRTKENAGNILNELRKFSYRREEEHVSVRLIDDERVSIALDTKTSIKINQYAFDDAVSLLYKDRKFINKVMFQ